MKVGIVDPIIINKANFISHMVQMKDSRKWRDKDTLFWLYIPHGSDERTVKMIMAQGSTLALYPTWFRWKAGSESIIEMPVKIFISHMVQMKGAKVSGRFKCIYNLYIPHGSDERLICSEKQKEKKHFISHMVQMKEKLSLTAKCNNQSLYPTWFRWKRGKKSPLWKVLHSLYPTWFRWKGRQLLPKALKSLIFISHMVQMKDLKK